MNILLALDLSRYFFGCSVVSLFLLSILPILMHNAIIKKVPNEPAIMDSRKLSEIRLIKNRMVQGKANKVN